MSEISRTEKALKEYYREIEAGMTLADRRRLVADLSAQLLWLEDKIPSWATPEFKASYTAALEDMWKQIDRIVKEYGLAEGTPC